MWGQFRRSVGSQGGDGSSNNEVVCTLVVCVCVCVCMHAHTKRKGWAAKFGGVVVLASPSSSSGISLMQRLLNLFDW